MAGDGEFDLALLRQALGETDDWEEDFARCFTLEDTTCESLRPATPLALEPLRPRVLKPYPSRAPLRKALPQSIEARALDKEWESIVRGQRQQRDKAQEENSQLRKTLASQQKRALKITQLLERSMQLDKRMPWASRAMVVGSRFRDYRGPRLEPKDQLARLDELAKETKDAFSTGVFSDKTPRETFRDVQFVIGHREDNHVEVTFGMAWDLPFAVEDVCAALWIQTTRASHKAKHALWMDLHEEDRAMVSRFISTPTDGGEVAIKHGQTASRWVSPTTSNKPVLLLSTTSLRAFEHGRIKGEGSCNTWISVENIGRAGCSISHVKWCRRVRIRPPHAGKWTPAERSQWIQCVIAPPSRRREKGTLDWNMQAVENVLLDSIVAKRTDA